MRKKSLRAHGMMDGFKVDRVKSGDHLALLHPDSFEAYVIIEISK
jgi:hypothetical protein